MGGRGRLGQFVVVSTVALLLGALPATAGLVVELEPNDTFATAQILAPGALPSISTPNIGTGAGGGFVNTSTLIPHVTITESGDTSASLDFFSFTTNVAGVIILDIDSAPQATNFDTTIHLFDAAGTPLASSDDNNDDPGDGPGSSGGRSIPGSRRACCPQATTWRRCPLSSPTHLLAATSPIRLMRGGRTP